MRKNSFRIKQPYNGEWLGRKEKYQYICMSKVNFRKIAAAHHSFLQHELWRTIDRMQQAGHLKNFLDSLFTESERVMFARRIQIAKLLLRGDSFDEIQKKLHVGQHTVEQVDAWLRTLPDYATIFHDISDAAKNGRFSIESGTFRALRKKYPIHFLLFQGNEMRRENDHR